MLTPIDIQKQDFAVKLRGYDADEVDNFLDMLGNDYEKLYRENKELKDELDLAKQTINHYKEMEQTLQQSIMLAQKAAEDIKQNAAKTAEGIVNEAESKTADLFRHTEEEINKKRNELASVKVEVQGYRSKMKGICDGILELLEKIE